MRLALITAALACLTAAAPSPSHVVHEKRSGLPVAWKHLSRADRSTVLPVRIGLKQSNLEHGNKFLEDVSDPESPNFGMPSG